MTNLQELIDLTNKLSDRLDQAAADEEKFCIEICLILEQMSFEMFRAGNDLKTLKDYNRR